MTSITNAVVVLSGDGDAPWLARVLQHLHGLPVDGWTEARLAPGIDRQRALLRVAGGAPAVVVLASAALISGPLWRDAQEALQEALRRQALLPLVLSEHLDAPLLRGVQTVNGAAGPLRHFAA